MFQLVSTKYFLACMALRCLFLSASLRGPCLFSSPCLGRFCGHGAVSLPDTHPPLAVHCPRLCCCFHTFPLLCGFVNQSVLLCQCFNACLYVFLCLPHVTFCQFFVVSFFFLPGPPSYMCLPVVLPSKALLRNLSQIASMKTRATIFSTCSRPPKTWGGLLVQKFHGNLHEAVLG